MTTTTRGAGNPPVISLPIVSVSCMAFAPDGKRLVIAGGPTVKVYDLAKPQAEPTVLGSLPGFVKDVRFSPDGATVVAAGDGGNIFLWQAGQAEPTKLKTDTWSVSCTQISADGQTLVAAATGGIQTWSLKTNTKTGSVPINSNAKRPVVLSPDLQYAAAQHEFPYPGIQVWDVKTGKALSDVKFKQMVWGDPVFCPDSHSLAAATMGQAVDVMSINDSKTVTSVSGPAVNLAVSPKKAVLAIGSWEMGKPNRVTVLDLTTKKQTVVADGLNNVADCLAVSPDGKRVAVNVRSSDTIDIYEVK